MKDAYYFSHDCNARTDPKILKLRTDHGAAGYGVYFMLIEMLREANAQALPYQCSSLAYELHVDEKLVASVITDYDLFVVSDNIFYSESLNNRMKMKEQRSEKLREAGRLGGLRSAQARLKRGSSNPQPLKERKGKERKESSIIPPSVEMVKKYCGERGNSVNPQRFIDHYDSNGWKVGGKSRMKDWKAAVRTWEGNGVGDVVVQNKDQVVL